MLDYRYTVVCVGAVVLFEMEAVHLLYVCERRELCCCMTLEPYSCLQCELCSCKRQELCS